MTTLAGELALLVLDDASGRRRTDGGTLDALLAGAVITELVLRDRLSLEGKQVWATATKPAGEPVLDAALARIAAEGRLRKIDWWIPRLRKGLRTRVLDGLVAQGVLRTERQRVFGIFPVTLYPEVDGSVKAEVRTRLDAVVLHGAEPDARTAALAALVEVGSLARKVWPDADRKRVKARLRTLSEGDAVAASVRRAIQAAQTAAAVAAATAAMGGAAASS